MKLSPDQESALEQAAKWLAQAPSPDYEKKYILGDERPVTVGYAQEYPVFSVGGLAGTGKTTLMRTMGEQYAGVRFVTPTHKAAAVLRSKLPAELKGHVNTYHQLIYLPKPSYTCRLSGLAMSALDACGCQPDDLCEHAPQFEPCRRHEVHPAPDGTYACEAQEKLEFEKREFIAGHISLIVIDEASMLTDSDITDIRSYGIPVMTVGDYGQLGPVKGTVNEHVSHPRAVLTVNHRQGENSGIIDAALDARATGILSRVRYGSSVRVLEKSDPKVSGLLERFRPDAKDRAVIVQFNRTRAQLNQAFHAQYGTDVLHEGERLISLQRMDNATVLNPSTGEATGETKVFNGTLATVRRVDRITSRFVYAVLELDNDWRGREGVHIIVKMTADQLGAAQRLPLDKKPRDASDWDYAYALTVHRSQGSEFSQVVVVQESKGDKRSLYTAITRAREGLVVIS